MKIQLVLMELKFRSSEFEAMENTIEKFGLSKLMDETLIDESLDKKSAIEYYNNSKTMWKVEYKKIFLKELMLPKRNQ